MSGEPQNRTGRAMTVPLAAALAALILLALHAYYYMPFLSDDALISLRYTKRLLQGHGLTWTDGRPVEGYSNLLWVLLTALIGRLGVDLVDGVRMLGLACGGMLLGAIGYGYHATTLKGSLPMIVGLLTVVLAGPMAIWTIGGLETILVAGLLGWAMVLCYPVFQQENPPAKYPLAASVFLALLCITRPDGALFTAATVLAVFVVRGIRGQAFRTGLMLAALPAAFYLGQLAFRLAYYGEWVPNTALVKISLSSTHLARGTLYVLRGLLRLSPLSILALWFVAILLLQRRCRGSRARIVLLAVCGIAWSGYVAAVGGDTFPAWRQLVPAVALMALILAEGVQWWMRYARIRIPVVLGPLVLIASFGSYGYLQFTDPLNREALDERWEWDGQVVGLMLKRGFADAQPLLAVTAAGCLPYWSELPALDMLGLNDYYLPRHPPKDFGRGRPGHELGDGQYVLSRRPDLIIFGGPRGSETAHFLSGRQMQQDPEFYRRYVLVNFEGREPYPVRTRIWVLRESPKIGVQRSDAEIRIPGFLFAGNPDSAAYLDAEGRFVVPVSAGQPAVYENLLLPPGTWRVEVDASAGIQVVLRPAGQGGTLWDASTRSTFEQREPAHIPLDVVLQSPTAEPAEVRELVFHRSQPATE